MMQNRYLISLICLVIFLINSCRDNTFLNESKQNEVLLSKLSLPKDYKLIFKGKNYPEGEMSNKNDSIYIFNKGESKIEITVKYFFNKTELENIDDRINSYTEELYSDNNSFNVKYKKVNKKLSVWYLKYSFGRKNDLMYNFYMERNTCKYRIVIKSFNFDISLKDIEYLYMQISKYNKGECLKL